MPQWKLKELFLLLVALLSTICCFVARDTLSNPLNEGQSQKKLAQNAQKHTPRQDVLRDKNGCRIGEIQVGYDGHEILRDNNGFKLGEYDPRFNQTRDKNGTLVGTGNLLRGLIDQGSRKTGDVLRDKQGFEIGDIKVQSDERQVLRDKNGFYVGEYDPKSNETRDKRGFLVGTGNLLVGRIDQGSRKTREDLRDKQGFLIGEIEFRSDERQILRDKHGFLLGEYDPKSNETRDKRGFFVGTGNLLPMLLKLTDN